MAHLRRSLISLLAVLGLLSALSSSSATLAAPAINAAMAPPGTHMDACGHGSMPNAPVNHDYQNCATMCCAVLSPAGTIAPQLLLPYAPTVAAPEPLSGIDPGLDPPPPRRA
jgi:hypothetical protein